MYWIAFDMAGRDEPSGFYRCPCDVPKKCSNRDRCEVEDLMCRAFEEWANSGRCRAKIGEWLISMTQLHFPNKSKHSRDMAFKPRTVTQGFMERVVELYETGLSQKEVGRQMGISRNYVGTIVSRIRKESKNGR